MSRRILSSLLSFSLLFQVLWMPAAFARPVESAFLQEAENEVRAALVDQRSKDVWDKIETVSYRLNGSEAEDKLMEKFQLENPEYDKHLIDDITNAKRWSLRNFIFRFYTNLDKRKRAAIVWGVFDNKLRYLPYDIPAVQDVVNESIELANHVSNYMSTNAPEEDRMSVAIWYMLNVYGKLLGQLSLFSQERNAYDAIRLVHSKIRLKLPYSLANKYKDNLKAFEIVIKNDSYMTFMGDTYLEYTPKMLLDLYTMAAAQIPTAHFYLNASRYRTIKNTLKRVDFYKLTLNEYDETPIPNSCRNIISTHFPATAPVDEVSEEDREFKMNALLAESGLILYNTTPEANIRYSTYAEYYKDYASATIMGYDAGFNGLLPYEDYFASQTALNPQGDLFVRYYNSPQINDVEHFETILQGKGAQVEQFIAKKSEIRNKDMSYIQELAESTEEYVAGSSYQVIAMDTVKLINELVEASYQIENIWKEMATFTLPDEVRNQTTADGQTTIEVDGLNYYLAKRMVDAKVNVLEEIVPEEIKEKMRRRWVRIRMPHINSHDTWRKWAMQLMVDLIDKYVDSPLTEQYTEKVLGSFSIGCNHYYQQTQEFPAVCKDGIYNQPLSRNMDPSRQIMRNIRKKIMPDESEADIFPRLSYDVEKLNEFYPILQRVWDALQAEGILVDATVTEWEYLVSQLPYNGWAVLRLSHLIKEEEMKNDASIIYETKNYYKKIIGMLALNRTFEPFHADRMLSKDEKRIFWQDIENQVDEKNFFIYKSKNSVSDKPYYEILRHINDLNLFSQENRDYVMRIIGNNVDRDELEESLDVVMHSDLKKEVDHLNEMYKNMDDLDKLQEMYDYYFDNFPHTDQENEFMDANPMAYIDVKDRFLMHEASIKTPLYQHALKEAAFVALQDTNEMFDKLCQYEYLSGGNKNKYEVSREGYNDLFAITSKAHTEFNQEFQLGVPKWAQKFADRMSEADWKAMAWAFGSAALYIISIPLTGGMTLGLSPVVASALTAKVVIAAAALEFISGGIFEWQVIQDAKKRTVERQSFREFGTMNAEVNEKIGYSYVWVALEVCFFSQLIGQVLKGVKLFTRTAYAAKKGVFRALSHADALQEYQKIARRVMTSNARAVLDINRRIFKVAGDNWLKKGLKALRFEYLRGFKGTITPIQANAQLAKTMARYFEDTPDQLRGFLKNYPQDRHIKLQKKIVDLENTSFAFRRRHRIAKLTEEAAKFESGSSTVKRLIDDLATLPSGSSLEDFILKNVDEISKVSMQLSWRAWQHSAKAGEVFYHVLITGMPAGNKRLPILRNLVSHTPWLGTINDRILIQRMLSARQILIQDHNVKLAAQQLGIGFGNPTKYKLTQTFSELVDRFTRSEAAQSVPEEVEAILKKMKNLDDMMAENIIKHYKSWGITHPLSKLDPITRKSANELVVLLKEADPKAIAALNNTPVHKLFSMEIDNDTAFDVMKDLSEHVYRQFKEKEKITVEEFEILVNALKLRSMAITPRKYFPELKHTI